MAIFIAVLLLAGLGVALMWGLLAVLRNLLERDCQGEPVFHEPGPIFHDHVAEFRQARSQFAWQSRSHFRGPD